MILVALSTSHSEHYGRRSFPAKPLELKEAFIPVLEKLFGGKVEGAVENDEVCSGRVCMVHRIHQPFQEQGRLWWTTSPAEILDPIRNLWILCECERASMYVLCVCLLCHHELIIFLLSHRSATHNHLSQPVSVSEPTPLVTVYQSKAPSGSAQTPRDHRL